MTASKITLTPLTKNDRFGPQDDANPEDGEGPDEMFRFVKYMK